MANLQLTPDEEKIILDKRAKDRSAFLQSPVINQAQVVILTLIDDVLDYARENSCDGEQFDAVKEARRVLRLLEHPSLDVYNG